MFVRPLLVFAAILSCLCTAATASAQMQLGLQNEGTLLTGNADLQRSTLDDSKAAGAQLVRVTMRWDIVARGCAGQSTAALASNANTCYDWHTYDQVASMARARGINVLTSVYATPAWLAPSIASVGASPNQTIAAYAAFCHAAASRYASTSPIGTIRYWTMWNEPNSSVFLTQGRTTPAIYAQLVVRGAKAIKSADRKLLVAVGPTGPKSSTKPLPWLRAVTAQLDRLHAGPYIDAVAHNPYQVTANPAARAYKQGSGAVGMGNLPELIAVIDHSKSLKAKPIWYTEFAYETKPSKRGVSLTAQAQWLADAVRVSSQSHRVQMLVWYVFKDPTSVDDWHSGLRFANGAAKPSYASFQRPISIDHLGKLTRVWGRSQVAPGSQHLVYRKRGAKKWKSLHSRRDRSGLLVAALPKGTWQVAVKDSLGLSRILITRS